VIKIILVILFALLLTLNVLVLQIHYELQDTILYLDAIYNELSICEDLNNEYILPTQ